MSEKTSEFEGKSIIFQKIPLENANETQGEEPKNKNQSLKCSEYWDELNEKHNHSIDEIMNKINESNINEIRKEIESYDINDNYQNSNNAIGAIYDIDSFININNNNNNIIINVNENINLKYRQISGDGNCFFRAVIFFS